MSQSSASPSLQQYSHAHPFQYLTKLNQVFYSYTRTSTKDYSSVSKLKLPFKPFSQIKVPQCFSQSYAQEQKDIVDYSPVLEDKTDDAQKRLWKEHKDIMEKYVKGREERKRRSRPQSSMRSSQSLLMKDKNNLFLKKILDRGTSLAYDQKKFQKQMISKLKQCRRGGFRRAKSRCNTAKFGESRVQRQQQKQNVRTKIEDNEYLQFNRQQELIVRYKGIMKQADCSLSGKNVGRTVELLGKMQKMVDAKYL